MTCRRDNLDIADFSLREDEFKACALPNELRLPGRRILPSWVTVVRRVTDASAVLEGDKDAAAAAAARAPSVAFGKIFRDVRAPASAAGQPLPKKLTKGRQTEGSRYGTARSMRSGVSTRSLGGTTAEGDGMDGVIVGGAYDSKVDLDLASYMAGVGLGAGAGAAGAENGGWSGMQSGRSADHVGGLVVTGHGTTSTNQRSDIDAFRTRAMSLQASEQDLPESSPVEKGGNDDDYDDVANGGHPSPDHLRTSSGGRGGGRRQDGADTVMHARAVMKPVSPIERAGAGLSPDSKPKGSVSTSPAGALESTGAGAVAKGTDERDADVDHVAAQPNRWANGGEVASNGHAHKGSASHVDAVEPIANGRRNRDIAHDVECSPTRHDRANTRRRDEQHEAINAYDTSSGTEGAGAFVTPQGNTTVVGGKQATPSSTTAHLLDTEPVPTGVSDSPMGAGRFARFAGNTDLGLDDEVETRFGRVSGPSDLGKRQVSHQSGSDRSNDSSDAERPRPEMTVEMVASDDYDDEDDEGGDNGEGLNVDGENSDQSQGNEGERLISSADTNASFATDGSGLQLPMDTHLSEDGAGHVSYQIDDDGLLSEVTVSRIDDTQGVTRPLEDDAVQVRNLHVVAADPVSRREPKSHRQGAQAQSPDGDEDCQDSSCDSGDEWMSRLEEEARHQRKIIAQEGLGALFREVCATDSEEEESTDRSSGGVAKRGQTSQDRKRVVADGRQVAAADDHHATTTATATATATTIVKQEQLQQQQRDEEQQHQLEQQREQQCEQKQQQQRPQSERETHVANGVEPVQKGVYQSRVPDEHDFEAFRSIVNNLASLEPVCAEDSGDSTAATPVRPVDPAQSEDRWAWSNGQERLAEYGAEGTSGPVGSDEADQGRTSSSVSDGYDDITGRRTLKGAQESSSQGDSHGGNKGGTCGEEQEDDDEGGEENGDEWEYQAPMDDDDASGQHEHGQEHPYMLTFFGDAEGRFSPPVYSADDPFISDSEFGSRATSRMSGYDGDGGTIPSAVSTLESQAVEQNMVAMRYDPVLDMYVDHQGKLFKYITRDGQGVE